MSQHPTDTEALAIADFGYVVAGGSYVRADDAEHYTGHLYAGRYTPAARTQPVPVVMVHGGVQTGSNFIGTPEGRRG